MSAEAIVIVGVLELAEFVAALRDLKRERRETRSMRAADGAVHRVELVFKDALGRDVGVQKAGEGYRILPDCSGLSKEQAKAQAESVQQVVQRYAYRKILKELQAQGYMLVEEEKRPDSSIRLVVRKWS